MTGQNDRYIQYETALPGYRQWILFTAEGIGIAAAVDELFYRKLWAMLPLMALSAWWIAYRKNEWRKGRKEELVRDFKEALNALAISLRAGVSVENAVSEVYDTLRRTLGSDRDMTVEFGRIESDLHLGFPAEKLFENFARRSGCEEIQNFAVVFSAGKRMGGNLSAIIRKTADQIGAGIEIEEEIQTILAAKRLEQKIMTVMPCGIIAYLQLTSPSYLSVLYNSAAGALFMTICLILWIAAAIWGNSIVQTEG
jgi:tight adherence protein B